ncbi:MAG: hypothetical protein FJZ63_07855, partial [Chlamydiae bacterium]|nr:hypothetical protein [Chlamydiota bacterium]
MTIAELHTFYDPKLHTGACLPVDLTLSSSLHFEKLLHEATSIQEKGGKIFWQLRLDFTEGVKHYPFEGLLN